MVPVYCISRSQELKIEFLTKNLKKSSYQKPLDRFLYNFRFMFSSILQIWFVEVPIYRSFSESLLDFEITSVNCSCLLTLRVSFFYEFFLSKDTFIWLFNNLWGIHTLNADNDDADQTTWIYLECAFGLFNCRSVSRIRHSRFFLRQ